MTQLRHAGKAIADSLALHGVDRAYVVPGESYLALLDGLYDVPSIDVVVTRHEAAAAYMADAHGKFTGKPGVAMVTRGPGAAQAFTGIHTAWQDGVPLVLFVGLIPIADRGRESFQEFDPHAWFGTQCKRVLVLDEPERASEIVAEAFFAAQEGRPGPVVVGLPEDVIKLPFTGALHPVIPVAEGGVSAADLAQIETALAGAEKPLLFVGGQRWDERACAQITAFAETNQIPVLHDWRAADRVPFHSPSHAGYLGYGRSDGAVAMFEAADVVVSIGAVPTDVATEGFSARQSWQQVNYLVNIDTSLRGRSGAVTQHVLASPKAFAQAISNVRLAPSAARAAWCAQGHQIQQADARLPAANALPETAAGTAHMSAVLAEVLTRLPQDAVYSFGAGNHCLWAQRYLPTNVFPSQLSTRNGAMGYALPAGIVAALAAPKRQAVVVTGDGEFMMNDAELSTAVRYGAPVLIILMDNQQYGTIRDHQEQHFPDRVSGTQLHNPDFAALIKAHGGFGVKIDSDDQIEEAVRLAFDAIEKEGKPALLHVRTDQRLSVP